MRVLVVVHDYLPRHVGGAELHAHHVARELARRGHAVTALFTERDLAAEEGTLRRGSLDGVETLEVVHQREYADLSETWTQELSSRVFERVLSDLRPEVVHFQHLAFWGSRTLGLAKEFGARVVVTLHDYFLLCDAATLLRSDGSLCTEGLAGRCSDCLLRHPLLPERWGASAGAERRPFDARAAAARFAYHREDARHVDQWISPSRFLAETFVEAGFAPRERFTILRYGYPGERRAPRRLDRSRALLRVGYLGGVYPSKGVHVLVGAFKHLVGEPLELHVHGHLDWFPEYAAGLRRGAAGLPITFHGGFAPGGADRVLADLDVLVCPSIWYENLPITIFEAFRNGLPVIATDLGGMKEAVEHDVNGLCFPRGDERALAATLARLAREPGLYERLARGRPSIETLEEVVGRLEALYQR